MPKGIPSKGMNNGWFKKGTPSVNKGKVFFDRRGSASRSWKGGLPKCLDCNKALSSYTSKRCGSCFHKLRSGKNHPMFGVRRLGEKAPNWKGNKCKTKRIKIIRNGIKYKNWVKGIFLRDDWVCQKCLFRGGNLEAHHIKSFSKFPKLRFRKDNGITLCVKCHKTIHKGKRRNHVPILFVS